MNCTFKLASGSTGLNQTSGWCIAFCCYFFIFTVSIQGLRPEGKILGGTIPEIRPIRCIIEKLTKVSGGEGGRSTQDLLAKQRNEQYDAVTLPPTPPKLTAPRCDLP